MGDIVKCRQFLSNVATNTNRAFLALLLDFLNSINKEEREKFFHDNRKNMDTFVGYYWDEFKKGFYQKQSKKIEKYHATICQKTKTEPKIENGFTIDKWRRFFYNRVLYIYLYQNSKENGHRIGIECAFEEETNEHPLGLFHIYIASWAGPHFKPYEQAIRETFPDRFINNKTANKRVFIPIAVLDPDKQEDAIISTLEDTYNKLKKIIDEKQKMEKHLK